MTPDELIEIVGGAYGEPGGDIAEALFDLVHETYDQDGTDAEQAAALFMALWHVKERLERVLNAVDQVGRNAYQ